MFYLSTQKVMSSFKDWKSDTKFSSGLRYSQNTVHWFAVLAVILNWTDEGIFLTVFK